MMKLIAALILLAIPALILGGLWRIHPGLAMLGSGLGLLYFVAVGYRNARGRAVEDALAGVERATKRRADSN